MPIGAFLAGLVLGILIAANKVKPTRILGIGYIFASVPILTGSLPQFISRFVGAAVLARLSIALSWTGYICALAFSLCICLYIHKRYGKKLIYIESFAKITSPNLSGKLLYRFADQFYVQWESMLKIYPKAICLGGIY